MSEPTEEHGIDGAAYQRTVLGSEPRLFCLCRFAAGDGCTTWEEAGAELDAHLAETAEARAR